MGDEAATGDRRTRTVRNLVEPVAGVAFFAVEVHDRYAALGFANPVGERDGIRAFDWTAYFAARAACLAPPGGGEVDARAAAAAFGVFPEARVVAALDEAYAMTTPAALLAARLEGTVLALQRLLAGPANPTYGADHGASSTPGTNPTDHGADPSAGVPGPANPADNEAGDSAGGIGGVGGDVAADPEWAAQGEDGLAFAVEVLDRGLAAAPTGESPLFAGLRALPRPESLLGRWWRLCDQYREQRMDVHVAAMTDAGLDGCQACLLNDARQGLGIGTYVRTRGWTSEEIDEAATALRDRGLIDDSALTDRGRAFREELEAATDAGQTAILDAIGDDLEPFVAAVGWQRQAIIDGYGYPGRRFVESTATTARRRG